jgi:hypothetical protein
VWKDQMQSHILGLVSSSISFTSICGIWYFEMPPSILILDSISE